MLIGFSYLMIAASFMLISRKSRYKKYFLPLGLTCLIILQDCSCLCFGHLLLSDGVFYVPHPLPPMLAYLTKSHLARVAHGPFARLDCWVFLCKKQHQQSGILKQLDLVPVWSSKILPYISYLTFEICCNEHLFFLFRIFFQWSY
jgi:hypothetical protein